MKIKDKVLIFLRSVLYLASTFMVVGVLFRFQLQSIFGPAMLLHILGLFLLFSCFYVTVRIIRYLLLKYYFKRKAGSLEDVMGVYALFFLVRIVIYLYLFIQSVSQPVNV